jgi:hypothetical protein
MVYGLKCLTNLIKYLRNLILLKCFKLFQCYSSTISRYLNKNRSYNGFIFKSYENNEPKIFTIETRLKMSLRTHGVKVKIFDKFNNLVNTFPTMISVAKHFNVSSRTIGRYLKINPIMVLHLNLIKIK